MVRAAVLTLSLAVVVLGALVMFAATKFLPRPDSADLAVRGLLVGFGFIALGLWYSLAGARKARRDRQR
jgi:hypothetical protein